MTKLRKRLKNFYHNLKSVVSSHNLNITGIKFMKKIEQIVKQIQNSKLKMVIAITGGGSEIIPMLLRSGGGSSYLIEAIVPYSQNSLISFLKREPEKFCSKETACKMAAASLDIALKNSGNLGVGMTCSLSKENERNEREHWIHIALCSEYETKSFSIQLNAKKSSFFVNEKSLRTKQESESATLLLMAIGSVLCEKSAKEFKVKKYESDSAHVNDITDNSITNSLSFKNELIYPGSFDPIHSSHKEIIKAASKLTSKKVITEISIRNVDKPIIDLISLRNRINSIKAIDALCVITDAPLFKQKAQLFKNSTFIIGYDTYSRLTKSIEKGETLLEDLEGLNFLVFHRSGYEINKISELSLQCEFVSHEVYYDHNSMSSTKIRNDKKQ